MDSITISIDEVRQLVTSAGEQLTAAEAAAEAGWFHRRAAGLWKDTDRPLNKWTLDRSGRDYGFNLGARTR